MNAAEERTGTLYVRLTAAPRLPRDTFGRRSSPPGRVLLRAAAEAAAGLHGPEGPSGPSGPHGPPERLPDGRWHWPDSGWRGSVSHTGALGLVALARGTWVGADVQEHRERPAALRWLARVLGRPPGSAATLREWAEVEALLKARGTAGIRPERLEPLPGWRPGWRDAGDGWWLWSGTLEGTGPLYRSRPSHPSYPETYVALAARAPLDVRSLPPGGPGEHPLFPEDVTEHPAPESPTRTKGTQR
ncbi:hypothetical protein ACH4PU_13760 [Streptomyces sp. NPDC021100]|uniref:hypothetical protein n=1 Tax=Streptomyces sp. NPDC021100 TaxID=3365114 RepID=UPI0037ACB252